MAVKRKVEFFIDENEDNLDEAKAELLDYLGVGSYVLYACTTKDKNRTLSQAKYLHGVVLATINETVGHTNSELLRYLEQVLLDKEKLTLSHTKEFSVLQNRFDADGDSDELWDDIWVLISDKLEVSLVDKIDLDMESNSDSTEYLLKLAEPHFQKTAYITPSVSAMKKDEMAKFIEQIIDWANVELGIVIPTAEDIREPKYQEVHVNVDSDFYKPMKKRAK